MWVQLLLRLPGYGGGADDAGGGGRAAAAPAKEEEKGRGRSAQGEIEPPSPRARPYAGTSTAEPRRKTIG